VTDDGRTTSLELPAATGPPAPATAGRAAPMGPLLRSLRPKQWVKNGFVVLPALFARELADVRNALMVAGAVACFCVVSSAVYLVNDVLDRGEDRIHPTKRLRPVAAGELPVRTALWAAVVLAVVAIGAALALDPLFCLVLCAYGVVSMSYTLWLKHEVILDVMGIAAGFVLRVIAGAAVIRVEPSVWILICTGLLALMLGFGKRRHEVISLGEDSPRHRQVLSYYSVTFLDSMLQLTAATTLASYAIYTATGVPASKHLAVTLPLVLYGVVRYLWLVKEKGLGGSPTTLVWTDRPMQVTLLAWVALSATMLAI
jgi:4-hydroxybenzoate polyprenyltransferase